MKIYKRVGSIFSLTQEDAEGLLIFIPPGLTTMRSDFNDFVAPLERVFSSDDGINAYRDNRTGQIVVAHENKANVLPSRDDAIRIVRAALGVVRRCRLKKIAMTGIRFAGKYSFPYYMERELVSWIDYSEFESVVFVDKRGGFAFIDGEV